jgi:hypothetical protein
VVYAVKEKEAGSIFSVLGIGRNVVPQEPEIRRQEEQRQRARSWGSDEVGMEMGRLKLPQAQDAVTVAVDDCEDAIVKQ